MKKLKKEDLLKFKNEDEKNCINFNINEFMDLVYQYDLYEYTNDIYDENAMMDEMKKNLEQYDWVNVRNMIINIHDVTENYFYRDAYGNYTNVTNGDLNYIIDDIIDNYEFSNEEDYDL